MSSNEDNSGAIIPVYVDTQTGQTARGAKSQRQYEDVFTCDAPRPVLIRHFERLRNGYPVAAACRVLKLELYDVESE